MGRPGGNSGKGGRNYRLNWHDGPEHLSSRHGAWELVDAGTIHVPSVEVRLNGKPMLRAYGRRVAPLRLKSIEHAKRWVEEQVRRYGPEGQEARRRALGLAHG